MCHLDFSVSDRYFFARACRRRYSKATDSIDSQIQVADGAVASSHFLFSLLIFLQHCTDKTFIESLYISENPRKADH
jgi:hypothetical protein